MVNDSSADRDPVEVLAEEFVERLRRGERPSIAEYKSQYPDLAEDIEDIFPALAMMDEIDPSAGELSQSEPPADDVLPKLKKLGDFRIIRQVGRGGMGVVYEAEQVSLGRHVALKVLPAAALPDNKHVLRFEREARSAAKLHHTNIVPVFGVGEQDGLHYYVMQFIQGLPLNDVIVELKKIQAQPTGAITSSMPLERTRSFQRQQSVAEVAHSLITGQFAATQIGDNDSGVESPAIAPTETSIGTATSDSSSSVITDTLNLSGSLSGSTMKLGKSGAQSAPGKTPTYWQSVANIGAQIADALQYAHEQAILHRDIKPSNLLLDLRGTTWVTDFGLAKATDQQDITHTGDILGTLRYMPPEAFDGNADARSDVYSLGLTLYELLAFQPAFSVKERHQLIKQVTTEAAPRLDKVNPQIPRDLVTIVHKAIERDPSHRYQTADELREDLQRFIVDEPINARRISLTERIVRWSRRNKGLATALATVGVLLLILSIGGTLMSLRLAKVVERAESAKEQAEQAVLSMSVERAGLAAERDQNNVAVLWFAHAAELAPESSLSRRDNLIRAAQFMRGVTRPVRMFQQDANWVEELSFDPSGRYLYSYSRARGESHPLICRLWDVQRGEPLKLPEFSGDLTAAAWCTGDRLVALGTSDGDVMIWDFREEDVMPIVACDDAIQDLAFSGDGETLAIAAGDSVRVWDRPEHREAMTVRLPGKSVGLVVLSEDGARLATTCGDQFLRVFACRGENEQKMLAEVPCRLGENVSTWEPMNIIRPSFVDHSQGVLYSDFDGMRYFDLEHRDCFALDFKLRKGYSVHATEPYAVFSHGWHGSQLLSSDDQINVTRSSIEHRAQQPIHSAVFRNDGLELLTAGGDRFLKSWNVADGSEGPLELAHSTAVSFVCVSPEGRRFATAQQGGLIIIWEAYEKTSLIESVDAPPQGGTLVCVSRDGKFFAPTGRTSRAASGGTTQVFDGGTRKPVGKPLTARGVLLDACFSHDGDHLLTLYSDNYPMSGNWGVLRTARPGVTTGRLQVWDWRSGEAWPEVPLKSEPRSIDVSADGRLVAVLCIDGTVTTFSLAFDSKTIQQQDQWKAADPITFNNHYIYNGALRFAPLGQLLAIWNTDQQVHVYDAASATHAYSVKHTGLTRDVVFSADGRLLASSSGVTGDNEVRVTDTRTGRLLAKPIPHPDWAFGLAFSPDGNLLASACRDSQARIWDWRRGQLYLPPLAHQHEVHVVSFSPDGRYVLTSGDDQMLRVWSTADGKPVIPPQHLSGAGWSIGWTGSSAVVAGSGRKLDVLDLERLGNWADLSPAKIVPFSELVANRKIENGGETQLTAEEWLKSYQLARAAMPDEFALTFASASDSSSVAKQSTDLLLRDVLAKVWEYVVPERIYALIRGTRLREAIEDLNSLIQNHPASYDLILLRGNVYARMGQWQEAVEDLAKAIELDPQEGAQAQDHLGLETSFGPRFALASLLAELDDKERYREHCRTYLEQFRNASRSEAGRALIACLWLPGTMTPEEWKDQTELVDRTLSTLNWRTIKGMYYYRAGDIGRSLELIPEDPDNSDSRRQTPVLFFWAMALHKNGQPKKSEEKLELAEKLLAAEMSKLFSGTSLQSTWYSWLASRALRREAVALIRGQESLQRLQDEDRCLRTVLEARGHQRWKAALDQLPEFEKPSDDVMYLQARAEIDLNLGNLEEAAEDYLRITELEPENILHFRKAGCLLVAIGDSDRYAKLCGEALKRFGDSKSIYTEENLVTLCLILPQDDFIETQVAQIAHKYVDPNAVNDDWANVASLLSAYRQEDYKRAIEWGDKCLETGKNNEDKSTAFRNMRAFAYLIQAMSYHQLKRADQARKALQRGRDTCNSGLPQCPDLGWWDTCISHALLREADKRINGK